MTRLRSSWRRTLTVPALMAILAVDAAAQNSLVDIGRDVFTRECASCHGDNGNGYGPRSWLLKERPPDLTKLSVAGAPFPRGSVANAITGAIRIEPSHGPSEMPYWRGSLATPVPGAADATVLDALLAFVEHIQRTPNRGATPGDIVAAGATLFKQRCVSCHGADGRGVRPSGTSVLTPPDLTTVHARRGAAPDPWRTFDLIARHNYKGATDMPSWYEVEIRTGSNRFLAVKNIEALAAFVESLQAR